MTISYDPILEVRDLPRVRVFTPVPSPQLGTALVLEATGREPLVIHSGERVPEARLGKYRKAFLVDLSQYGLRLDEALPSADRAFLHQCSVTFTCRVKDPALVVERGIRDMGQAVRLPLVRIMRAVARSYDIARSNEAEVALNDALEDFTGDAAVSLGSYLVELAVPGDSAARSSEEFHDASRERRLDEMRREEMSKILASGREEVIAQWLAKHGGDPSALLELEAEAKAVESEQVLRAVHMLTASGKGDEPFDTREERRRLLSRFLSEAPSLPASDPVRRGSRRSRIAGSLGPAESLDVAAETVAAEPDTEAPESEAAAESRRRSRLRGRTATDADAHDDGSRERASRAEEAPMPVSPSATSAKEARTTKGGRVRGIRPADRPPVRRDRPLNPDATESD